MAIPSKEELKANYKDVLKNVEEACDKVGRNPQEVKIIAVSKTKPLSLIEDAMEVGMDTFGENKPQEIRDKCANVSRNVHWHMIGKLQTNKIKYVIETCDLIHSVDSIKLLEKLEEEADKRNIQVKILLQINISGEASKSGFSENELYSLLTTLGKYPHLHVEGLMTIPPFVSNPEDNRGYFRRLKEIFIDIKSKNIDNISMNALSMGMTGDYQVAVEEGATFIRVGTGIFGERNYTK